MLIQKEIGKFTLADIMWHKAGFLPIADLPMPQVENPSARAILGKS